MGLVGLKLLCYLQILLQTAPFSTISLLYRDLQSICFDDRPLGNVSLSFELINKQNTLYNLLYINIVRRLCNLLHSFATIDSILSFLIPIFLGVFQSIITGIQDRLLVVMTNKRITATAFEFCALATEYWVPVNELLSLLRSYYQTVLIFLWIYNIPSSII